MRSLLATAAAAVVLVTTSLALAGPAAAQSGVVYDGDDPGPGYTPLEALALFVGLLWFDRDRSRGDGSVEGGEG